MIMVSNTYREITWLRTNSIKSPNSFMRVPRCLPNNTGKYTTVLIRSLIRECKFYFRQTVLVITYTRRNLYKTLKRLVNSNWIWSLNKLSRQPPRISLTHIGQLKNIRPSSSKITWFVGSPTSITVTSCQESVAPSFRSHFSSKCMRDTFLCRPKKRWCRLHSSWRKIGNRKLLSRRSRPNKTESNGSRKCNNSKSRAGKTILGVR